MGKIKNEIWELLMNIQKPSNSRNRLIFIDNIRLSMIILVVLVHTSVTYSGIGGWYYIENRSLDTVSKIVFAMFNTFSQAFFMGLLFFIAGYFVPAAYDKKGCGKFIKDRLIRLGIPVLIYILIINPFIEYFILGIFASNPKLNLIKYYSGYINSSRFIGGTGPLWFALALLIFSILYAAARKYLVKPFKLQENKWTPSHVLVCLIILLITLFTFVVRIFQPFGANIFNMQLCFFSQYIAYFIIGILAFHKNWLISLPYDFGMLWLKIGLGIGIVLWACIMLLGGPLQGKEYVILGGLYWQSAAYALWEQLFAAGISLGLIVVFRDKLSFQGKLTVLLSQNAFGVYVFHAPILIGICLLLKNLYFYPLIKFILVALITLPICFIISNFIRKVPIFRKIFS